jgi:hypothetical protein
VRTPDWKRVGQDLLWAAGSVIAAATVAGFLTWGFTVSYAAFKRRTDLDPRGAAVDAFNLVGCVGIIIALLYLSVREWS